MTRSMRCSSTSDRRSSSSPRVATLRVSARLSRGSGVHEPDEIQPVFGVLADLSGDELADLARTDDERAHGVGARSSRECPCNRASGRHENDRKEPERDETSELRRREPGHPDESLEEPRSERDDYERRRRSRRSSNGRCAPRLARRVPGACASSEPHRQRQDEEEDLPARLDAIAALRSETQATTCANASVMPIASAATSARRMSQPLRPCVATRSATSHESRRERRRSHPTPRPLRRRRFGRQPPSPPFPRISSCQAPVEPDHEPALSRAYSHGGSFGKGVPP